MMKRIAFFCIPAHGHTNPMLPVAAELVSRGDEVRFYSFDEFEEKIKHTGATFISCTPYLPKITDEEMDRLKKVKTTEMTIQDLRITLNMNDFLENEFKAFKPDIVYSDSVCFWGKLNAWKFDVPLVVSTSTFAFNQISSKYMKNSPSELADVIFGLPKVSAELKKLKPYGYKVKNTMQLVQSDNDTDSIVYTSMRFQPYAECFTGHYKFVGPSVFSKAVPQKEKERPLVYISLGTVVNDKPDFYSKCIAALKDLNVDVIISCGTYLDIKTLGELSENIKVYPSVNQLDVLSKADAFITHCGMNSVSESLYMATPMVLYPQTNEQIAVARRAKEIGAGMFLTDDSEQGIKTAVQEVLNNKTYADGAKKCSDDFRSCPGTAGAADFIESAPHTSNDVDIVKELKITDGIFSLIYWLIFTAVIVLLSIFVSWHFVWIIGLGASIIQIPLKQIIKNARYNKFAKKKRKELGLDQ